ncbi:hypothetical protein D3C86_1395880 [compost metagenome]
MLEHVAQRRLFVGHEVIGAVTYVGVTVQASARVAKHSAVGRQRVGEVAGLLLVLAQERQLGVVAGAIADGWGDVLTTVGNVVGLGIGFPEQAGQPVTPDALLVQRIPQVKGALLVILVAHLQLHFMQWLDRRALCHQIDLSARVGGSVKDRAGTAQHFNSFQTIGFGGIPTEKLRQEGARTIAQHAPGALLKTANGQLVGHKLRTGDFGIDARRIAQGL